MDYRYTILNTVIATSVFSAPILILLISLFLHEKTKTEKIKQRLFQGISNTIDRVEDTVKEAMIDLREDRHLQREQRPKYSSFQKDLIKVLAKVSNTVDQYLNPDIDK